MVRAVRRRTTGRGRLLLLLIAFASAGTALLLLLLLALSDDPRIPTAVDPEPTSDAALPDSVPPTTDAGGGGAIAPPGNERKERDFLSIASRTGTDKVAGESNLLAGINKFNATNPRCRVFGHFYHTMYQRWLGPLSGHDADPFQFVEIGFSNGDGLEAFVEFMPRAEVHSIEKKCDLFNRKKGRGWHGELVRRGRLHCGDASDVDFLLSVYAERLRRPGAPPLRVVVDDASHLSRHQAANVFFWFPRLAPRGLLIIEDVQPNAWSDEFRTNFIPNIMRDYHFCGTSSGGGWSPPDGVCYPTLQPLLASVHCEMHICVLERNDEEAVELGAEESGPPPNALRAGECPAAGTG